VVEQGWRAGGDLGHRELMIVGLFHEIDEGIHHDGREATKSLASDPERETGDAWCLVELRGFEPLTPCMPLTSQL
jgi:hypothetical protein